MNTWFWKKITFLSLFFSFPINEQEYREEPDDLQQQVFIILLYFIAEMNIIFLSERLRG